MAQTSKTPYEIRLEVLKMAKEHMDHMFAAQVDFAGQLFAAAVAANKTTVEELSKFAVQPYSMDDLMKKANELYAFILRKD
jgi:hypothetical protein